VTPDRLDTMRVCITWDSANVQGFIRYYPSPTNRYYGEYDYSIQLYEQNQAYGPTAFIALSGTFVRDNTTRPSFDVLGVVEPNIGGADNRQTYYSRGTVAVDGQQSTAVTGQSPSVTT
jgi:hypothetical protein